MLIRVEGTPFSKDTTTKALLATSNDVLLQNEARKKLSASLKNKDSEINKLKMEMQNVQSEMSEIKTLLNQLLSK